MKAACAAVLSNMMLFIMLYRVVLTFETVDKILKRTVSIHLQMNVIEQFFHLVLFAQFAPSLSVHTDMPSCFKKHPTRVDRGQTIELYEKQEKYFKLKFVIFRAQNLLFSQYSADLLTFLELYLKC